MVCNRCITAVQDVFEKNNLVPDKIVLGLVLINETPSPESLNALTNDLQALGFEVLDDKKAQVVEKTKSLIIALVHQDNALLKHNLSDYLAEALDMDYNQISALFSETEGVTIEKYHIAQKVERIKELLIYNELSLKEIAYQLHYSSVAHLSNQFKKVTGLTTSHFKKIGLGKRKPLDEV